MSSVRLIPVNEQLVTVARQAECYESRERWQSVRIRTGCGDSLGRSKAGATHTPDPPRGLLVQRVLPNSAMVRGHRSRRFGSLVVASWLTVALVAAAPAGILSARCETADPPCADHPHACPTALAAACCCQSQPVLAAAIALLPIAKASLIPTGGFWMVRSLRNDWQISRTGIDSWHGLNRSRLGPIDLPILHSTLRI